MMYELEDGKLVAIEQISETHDNRICLQLAHYVRRPSFSRSGQVLEAKRIFLETGANASEVASWASRHCLTKGCITSDRLEKASWCESVCIE